MVEKYGVLAKAAAAVGVSILASSAAFAESGPTITGNAWAAYGIIGGLIAIIVVFVLVSIGVERRDEAYERGHKHHNVLPGLPILGEEEDGED